MIFFNIRIRLFLFTAINLSVIQSNYGQLSQKNEIQIPINMDKEEDFTVLPLNEKGILVLNSQTTLFGKKAILNFLKYDSTLTLQWKTEFEIGDYFELEKYFFNSDYLYCLFKESEKSNIKILKLDLEKGFGFLTEAKMLTKMDIDFFSAVGNKVIIGGKYNDRPVVELGRLFDASFKVLPHLHANNVKLNAIEVNEETDEIFVMHRDDRKCNFSFSIYDYEGRLVKIMELGSKNKVILSGKIISMPNNKLMLSGNFSENCSDFSAGFYLMPLANQEEIKFFYFSDLQNFYSYLSPKRQQKITTRMNSRKAKGKDIKMRYRINLHEPIRIGNEITLLAEVYYPEYKNSIILERTMLNSVSTRPLKEYNNYKFTHALIFTFDTTGRKTWDYSINLKNLESAKLNEKVQITLYEEGYLVAYPKEELINSNFITKNFESKNFSTFDMKKNEEKKIGISDLTLDLVSWFDHTYLAFGNKTIRAESGIISKEFFYISKLKYVSPF